MAARAEISCSEHHFLVVRVITDSETVVFTISPSEAISMAAALTDYARTVMRYSAARSLDNIEAKLNEIRGDTDERP
jgi:hypothetical protein